MQSAHIIRENTCARPQRSCLPLPLKVARIKFRAPRLPALFRGTSAGLIAGAQRSQLEKNQITFTKCATANGKLSAYRTRIIRLSKKAALTIPGVSIREMASWNTLNENLISLLFTTRLRPNFQRVGPVVKPIFERNNVFKASNNTVSTAFCLFAI